MEEVKTITELPFYFGSTEHPDNEGKPVTFPFALVFDNELGMFRQENSPHLEKLLESVYEQGSLVDGSISSESGNVYVDQLLKYLLGQMRSKSEVILEIGFGSGLILSKLKESNFLNLSGIEPGSHPKVGGLESIDLIVGFFPSPKLTKTFDIVYSFLVLEHLSDPVSFLNQIVKQLNPNGKIIVSVPNCEPNISSGDPSMFIHEHYSYFTRHSLSEVVKKAELFIEDLSILEGMIVVTLSQKASKHVECAFPVFSEIEFFNKLNDQFSSLQQIFKKYSSTELALYSPGRAVNSLFLLNASHFRLVDDNSEIHNKYLPGLERPIESFKDLLASPPKCILIYSRTFGERIKAKCLDREEFRHTLVLTLNDLSFQ